ncbi:MAG: TonB-dependent siderophore receptor, partial [Microcoleus sp. SIO2G3]|nr:TonB-dependent siderophore receptor [Microcoleus sp. SIO2G3]
MRNVKYLLFLIGAIALALSDGRSAQAQLSDSETSPQPATTVDEWLTQIAQAGIAQITAVQLNPTAGGIEVTLETTGQLEPATSTVGNALIIDIPNAVLTSDEIETASPTEAIALVSVTNLPNNRVRVAITGTTAPPAAELRSTEGAIVLSVSTSTAETAGEEEEAIEITVTGEQADNDYFTPDASTATRTDTPTLDVPASIQVIPQQVLEDQQVTTVVEALENVSGVSADFDRNVLTDINIRGFTGAPILIDGFRLFGNTTPEETANLEQIEVLRGPASILFGEIQPGGFVNYVTERPTREPFYDLQFQAGSFGLIRPEIDLSGPLTDDERLLYRLNAVYNREDGFRNFETEFQRFFIAPVVTWQISDRTDLTILLEFLDEESPFDSGLVATSEGVLDIPFDRITNEPDDINRREFLNVGYSIEHRFSDNWRLRNAFRFTDQDYDTDVAIPLSFDEATNTVTRFYAAQEQFLSTYALQTNVVGEFATGSIDHTLLFGTDLSLSYDNGETIGDFNTPLPLNIFDPEYGTFPRPDRSEFDFLFGTDSETRRLGVYLQDQIDFGNLILLAGFRYDTVSAEDDLNNTEDNSDAFSPRLGIVYQPIENLSLYASYSQSFTPSFSTSASGAFLQPEQGEGFEFG